MDNIENVRCKKIEIKSKKDLASLKFVWSSLENGSDMTTYQSYNWNILLFNEWNNNAINRLTSEIIVYIVESGDKPTVLLPIILQKHTTKTKWSGKKKGIYILGYGSYSDYLNVIYKDFIKSDIDVLISTIKTDYPTYSLYFTDIREDTGFYSYLKNNYQLMNENIAIEVNLNGTFDDYSKRLSKHTRQNLRTSINRMKTDNIIYEYDIYGSICDDLILDKLREIHIGRLKTKNTNNVDVIHAVSTKIRLIIKEYNERFNNIIYESMKTMDNSCLFVVRLNNEIVGYLYGLKEKHVIRIMQNCFNEEYKFYSPLFRGAYDFIKELYSDSQYEIIDFTRGNEEYKYKLGGNEVKLGNFVV